MLDWRKQQGSGRRWAGTLVAGCMGVAILHAAVGWSQGVATTRQAAKIDNFTIGRDTTYLTGPLLPDAMVDYAEAMNAGTGKGVTPENNAACVIARIVRRGEDNWIKVHEESLARMGVDAKATKVTWTVSPDKLDEVVTARNAGSRPWKAAEIPELAAWLESNKAAMDLFVEASRRREWWVPVRWLRGMLDFGDMGLWANTRSPARAMWSRSMLRLGEGNVGGAWDDLAACERMAGLVARSPDLTGKLMAAGIHQGTMEGMRGMIEHGELSAGTLREMDALLKEQKPWPKGGEIVPQSERYMFLTTVSIYAKGLQEAWDTSGNGLKEQYQAAGMRLPDWNRAMRLGNRMYDMLQADETGMSVKQRAEHRHVMTARISELTAIYETTKPGWKADLTEDNTWLLPRVGEKQDAYSDRIGTVVAIMVSPKPEGPRHKFDLCNELTAWTRVAVALLRYRQDRGVYPPDLKALVPGYLAALPEANAERPMRYGMATKGFVLTNESTATTQEGSAKWGFTIRRER